MKRVKKQKWGLQATITVLVCCVVAVCLFVTDIRISKTIADSIEKSQREKATNVARMVAHSDIVIDALEKGKW
ncbi:hypothetical protein GCM10020331_036970 [Ectobacillus funiculus]